jgi:putative transposase
MKKNSISTKYTFIDNRAVYFTIATVAGWLDIFTREIYKTILLDSIR